MIKIISWVSGVISFSVIALLTAFSVQNIKMPDGIFATLVTVLVIAITGAIGVFIRFAWVLSSPIRNRYRLRISIENNDQPDPHQWLLDIAEYQNNQPHLFIKCTDCVWFQYSEQAAQPVLQVRCYYQNMGVHNLVIGTLDGHVLYNKERLSTGFYCDVKNQTVQVNGIFTINISIYVPPEVNDALMTEIRSEFGEIRNLQLNHIYTEIQTEDVGDFPTRWMLGAGINIIRRNGGRLVYS